jgi:imidazole glycerol-phosphate synthase subunit HisF
MLTKRIIPCLDVKMGRVVKGINFVNLKDVGDPVEIAEFYNEEGADELVFLDITATHEGRKTMIDVVKRTAEKIFIPLTIGGGISSIEDFKEILRAGADKISINSAAVRNPELITNAAERFGTQCVVVAIDGRKRSDGTGWNVVINGGRIDTGLDAIEWAKKVEISGAGEILLTSMDADGTKSGFDIEFTSKLSQSINIPVIASGGCGNLLHFKEVFEKTGADAALAASLFHYRELTIKQVKEYLKEGQVAVRL